MKSKKIAEVSPYLMDSHMLISFDANWIKLLGMPVFDVLLNSEGKLVLISKESVQNERNHSNQ